MMIRISSSTNCLTSFGDHPMFIPLIFLLRDKTDDDDDVTNNSMLTYMMTIQRQLQLL